MSFVSELKKGLHLLDLAEHGPIDR